MNASDGELVRNARRGDRDAFGELVRRYQRRLFGLVLMMVRRPAGAEDVTQDTLVRAYLHLERYDDARPFYPWLASIAVRLAQNWLRDQGRTLKREGELFAGTPESPAHDLALETVIEDERSRRLWREVASLSSGERTAVVLFYREEMSVGEIARALGVTTGTIKTFLFRARRRLRERMT